MKDRGSGAHRCRCYRIGTRTQNYRLVGRHGSSSSPLPWRNTKLRNTEGCCCCNAQHRFLGGPFVDMRTTHMSSKDCASSVSETFPTIKRFRFERTSFSCKPSQAKPSQGGRTKQSEGTHAEPSRAEKGSHARARSGACVRAKTKRQSRESGEGKKTVVEWGSEGRPYVSVANFSDEEQVGVATPGHRSHWQLLRRELCCTPGNRFTAPRLPSTPRKPPPRTGRKPRPCGV